MTRLSSHYSASANYRVGAEEGWRRIDAEVERLMGLGATKLRAYDENGELWTVMQDPEGNEFCIQ